MTIKQTPPRSGRSAEVPGSDRRHAHAIRGSLLRHIRDQWMGAVALFLVLASGTAYAANTVFSSDIVDGEVKTPDLADLAVTDAKLAGGSVLTGKLKNDAVIGGKVLDNTLKGADIDESTLNAIPITGPAGGDLGGNYPNPQIASNTVGAGEVINGSLTGLDIDEASLNSGSFAIGRSTRDSLTADCNANLGPMDCTTTTLTLPRSARVLLIASANWKVDSFNDFIGPDSGSDVTDAAWGQCFVLDNGVVVPDSSQKVGEGQVAPGADPVSFTQGFAAGGNLAVTTVTPVILPGAHNFTLRCQEDDGNVGFFRASLSAVMLDNT